MTASRDLAILEFVESHAAQLETALNTTVDFWETHLDTLNDQVAAGDRSADDWFVSLAHSSVVSWTNLRDEFERIQEIW